MSPLFNFFVSLGILSAKAKLETLPRKMMCFLLRSVTAFTAKQSVCVCGGGGGGGGAGGGGWGGGGVYVHVCVCGWVGVRSWVNLLGVSFRSALLLILTLNSFLACTFMCVRPGKSLCLVCV